MYVITLCCVILYILQALQKTDYGERDLYLLNFNDMTGSFVLLITCLHVSSWDTIAGGFSAVTNSSTSRAFFTAWYCVGVLLLMKVITSFFISAFVLRLGGEGTFSAGSNLPSASNQINLRKRAVLSATLAEPLLDGGSGPEPESQSQTDYGSQRSLHTMQSVIDKAETPQQQKLLSELSLRYSRTIDSVRHLQDLLHDENSSREGEGPRVKRQKKRKVARRTYSVNFSHTHGLKPEDMESIVSRMGHGDEV